MAWLPSVITAPSANTKINQKAKSKHAEKLSVNQRLPVEYLLEDFLRQELAPDPNDGNNYYVGKVVQVVEENNQEIEIFDIFNNSVSNLERFYSDYKTQNKVTTHQFIIHIPELYSTNWIDNGGQFLNYYTKFKINYSGKDTIKVNDLVKIVFKNAKTFSDPEIIAVYRSDGNNNQDVQLEGQLYTSLQQYTQCRNLQLNGSQAPNADLNSGFIESPVAGYYQLFDSLDYMLSPAGFKNYSRIQGPTSNLNPSKLITQIFCDSKVKELGKTKSNLTNKFFHDKSGVPEVIVGDENGRSSFEVLLRLISYENDKELLGSFSKFIDKQLFKFKFSTIISSIKTLETISYIDLSIDVQAIGMDINEASVDTYIATSEKLKNGGISNNNSNQETQQISQTLIAANTTFDPCENVQASVTNLYIPTTDLQKWKRASKDAVFVKFFFENSAGIKLPYNYPATLTKIDDLLKPENLYISGELTSKNSSNPFYLFEDLKKINNKFYSIPEKVKQENEKKKKSIGINSSFKGGNNNFISKDSLDRRISKLSDFLISLRDIIKSNEGIEDPEILILPINAIRAKKTNATDVESRHYYGQAVDFVVYVNLNGIVYQIPSIIVYLYCLKTVESFIGGSQKENSGFGVFIDEQYNHFEYLGFSSDELSPSDYKSGLSKSERQNGRLWINGGTVDELKKIDNQPIDKKERAIKDYVLKSIGTPVQKILRLI